MEEVGQVFNLSNDIASTVASRFKQQCGSVWITISLLLTTDDVVLLRTVARRWNVGDRCGALGDTFFWLQKMEQFEKAWHYDEQGRRTYTMLRLRNPIMDSIRRFGLQPPQEETQPDDQGMVDLTSFTDRPDSGRARVPR